jgi:cell filamentation protein
MKSSPVISAKYQVEVPAEFEPGSRRRVLRNLKHITSIRMMEDAELEGYMKAERLLVGKYGPRHSFTLRDINTIHRLFLGEIYVWAGQYRAVNLTKGGFPFASAMAIPAAMSRFERAFLKKLTPCRGGDINEIARRIAHVHVEFLLIHPYREGNGRTARLLATLSAYQAGVPGIDFGFIRSRGKEFDNYVAAIQHGIREDYSRMEQIVLRALERAQRSMRGA